MDSYTEDIRPNRTDAMIALVDEKLRDILRSHEATWSQADDEARYEYLKDVLRKTFKPLSNVKTRDLLLGRKQQPRESAGYFLEN